MEHHNVHTKSTLSHQSIINISLITLIQYGTELNKMANFSFIYSQGRIVGRCLSTAKYRQLYGQPNYPAYSKNDICSKNLLKTCQNKGLWSASDLTWSTLAKLSTLPPLEYPIIAPEASKMKFYNLNDTRLFVLTVNCYSDVQKGPQKNWHWLDFRPFLRPNTSIPGQFMAQFNIDEYKWRKDLVIWKNGHFCGRPP